MTSLVMRNRACLVRREERERTARLGEAVSPPRCCTCRTQSGTQVPHHSRCWEEGGEAPACVFTRSGAAWAQSFPCSGGLTVCWGCAGASVHGICSHKRTAALPQNISCIRHHFAWRRFWSN